MTHKQIGVDLETLYNDLGKACKAASFSRIVTICDKILKSFPADRYAQHCKIVALIRQDRFYDCLEFFRKQQIDGYHLERAYCEYRLNRLVEALKTVSSCTVVTQGLIELRAQIYYRLEEFERAIEEYEHLVKSCKDDYQDERQTNLIAAKAALSCFQGKAVPLNYSPALFETAFNAACYYIGIKDYVEALNYLNEAEKLCTEAFEEDTEATEDQINEEVAPIRVQKGFVMQQQRKADIALEIYHTILRQRSGDPSLMVVVSNNLICINKDQNVFDTRRRIKASSVDDLQHKLFQAQRSSILTNQALFYLNNNQLDACDAKLKAVSNEDSNNVRATMLSAVSLFKSKQSSDAAWLLENFAKSPAFEEVEKQDRLAVIFLLVHLQLMVASGTSLGTTPTAPLRAGKLTAEVADTLSEQILAKLLPQEIAMLPLVASLRVALLLGTGTGDTNCFDDATVKRAKGIVSETLEFWSKRSSDIIDSDRLLSRCIDFFRFHGFAEDAAHLLEQRLDALKRMSAGSQGAKKQQQEQQQQSLLALLIQAYSKFDHDKASRASRHLEFKEKLSEKEVDSLESIFIFNMKSIKKTGRVVTAQTPRSGGRAGESEGAAAAAPKKHKKKKRPPRLPKNYEPGVPPDPERWLPRRERTGYRGKRRDKRQPVHLQRGPQGVTSSAAPELDMGNTSASVASTPPSAGSGSAGVGVSTNAQRRPQQNKPHKSKKGKRR
ncbi:Signal recognition particle subunit SRP72 [Taenia solium]|eukprot:TsM_000798600 transcript=TsM_000798600 gene=TsM_000798600